MMLAKPRKKHTFMEQSQSTVSNPTKVAAFPPQQNPVKFISIVMCYFLWGSLIEFTLGTLFSVIYGAGKFREQMLKMCGAVWHGKMNYIDWFFRPDFECDTYKLNGIAVHGFILLNITLSYMIAKFVSNQVYKQEDPTYFRWVSKSAVIKWITIDVLFVFIIAAIRTYVIGFSPKDNIWALDFLAITIVHFVALFGIYKTYKFKSQDDTVELVPTEGIDSTPNP
jgi:hypothetical protein